MKKRMLIFYLTGLVCVGFDIGGLFVNKTSYMLIPSFLYLLFIYQSMVISKHLNED